VLPAQINKRFSGCYFAAGIAMMLCENFARGALAGAAAGADVQLFLQGLETAATPRHGVGDIALGNIAADADDHGSILMRMFLIGNI
jgi:hypothetical protein